VIISCPYIGTTFTFSFPTKQLKFMGNLLYIIAVILVIGWLVGFFAYGASGLIHVLLVLAVIAVLFNIISGGRRV
jgi:Family of unknown function (DUF5670)